MQPFIEMNTTLSSLIHNVPNSMDNDLLFNCTITNYTGQAIAVLGQEGGIRIIESANVDYRTHERYVQISYSIFHAAQPNPRRARAYKYPQPKENSGPSYNCNTMNITIERFKNRPLALGDVGLIIATAENIHQLQALTDTQVTFVERVAKLIIKQYFHSELNPNNPNPALQHTSPIVIFANEVSGLHSDLYVDINDIPCAIKVAHEAELGDCVFIFIRCADGNVAVHKLEDWSWARSAVHKFRFLDHEWIIGTSREEVTTKVHNRASVNAGKYTKDEVDSFVSRATAEKDSRIEAMKAQIDNQAETIKRLKEQLKEAQERAAQAESKTESSIKQQMAYANLFQSQQDHQAKRAQADYDREKQKRSDFMDIVKTVCAIVSAVISLVTVLFTVFKKASSS